MPKCIACDKPLEPPYLRHEFVGAPGSRLTGAAFFTCADHMRLTFPEREIELPVQAADIVTVSLEDGIWFAECRECAHLVAIKDVEDDAHLAAARHLARVHSGLVAA